MGTTMISKRICHNIMDAVHYLAKGTTNKLHGDIIINRVKDQLSEKDKMDELESLILLCMVQLCELRMLCQHDDGKFSMMREMLESTKVEHSSSTNMNLFPQPSEKQIDKATGLLTKEETLHSKPASSFSSDSLSGDEYTRDCKRLRTNTKKIKRSGRHVSSEKFHKCKKAKINHGISKLEYDSSSDENLYMNPTHAILATTIPSPSNHMMLSNRKLPSTCNIVRATATRRRRRQHKRIDPKSCQKECCASLKELENAKREEKDKAESKPSDQDTD